MLACSVVWSDGAMSATACRIPLRERLESEQTIHSKQSPLQMVKYDGQAVVVALVDYLVETDCVILAAVQTLARHLVASAVCLLDATTII
jgi:hypothetical protein